MGKRKFLLMGLCLAAVIAVLDNDPAFGVPSFARKYHTSCSTCHIAPPKLNGFGRAFRNNGYRMPGNDEDLIKQDRVPLGAPAWKQVWPEGLWPSDIPGGTFIGIALESNLSITPKARVTTEFDGIEEVGLLLGGTLGETFSFFGDLELFEDGKPGGIGRAFVNYTPSHQFNLTVGMFEPRAAPFSNHLRLTRQTSYLTNVFPTVPAGNFFGFSPNQRGVELWGGAEGPKKKGGLLYSFGVVNGQFGGAAEALEESPLRSTIEEIEEEAEEHGGEFDVNSGKDVYVQASYKIGGLGVFGGGATESLTQTNNWRDDSLTLGGYYYRGTTGAFIGNEEEEEFLNSGNHFYRAGVTADWWFKDLNVFAAYQYNHDRLRDRREFNAKLFMVEGSYVLPWPWIIPAVRFESVDPSFGRSFNRTTLSATILLRANALLTFDGTASRKAPNLPIFENQIKVGFRVYF